MDENLFNPQQKEDAKSIRRELAQLVASFTRNDMYGTMKHLTKNCRALNPSTPILFGPQGVARSYTVGFESAHVIKLDYKVDKFLVLKPEMAVTLSNARVHNNEGVLTSTHRGVKVWKKLDGRWLQHIDCNNLLHLYTN